MEENSLDLEKLLSSSLCLDAAPAQAMPYYKIEPLYEKYRNKDPLHVLGEDSFQPQKAIPDDVVGTPIQEFFRGSYIFITGGTGFLGKVLIEKLIRSVPHIGHIYLLIRGKRGKTAKDRFNELLDNQVFLRMKTEVPQYMTKLSVVEGDLLSPGLGLSPADQRMLIDHVTVVIHSAADIRFAEPLKTALISNVLGSRRILELTKQIVNLKSYVHVSTAFSWCVNRVIEEKVPMLNVDYREILSCLDTMSDDELERETARLLQGWPNVYTFSKALCETMLQAEGQGLPICIYRPTVVVCSYSEPVRGWADSLQGLCGMILLGGLGIMHVLRVGSDQPIVDNVPVDYAVNSIIAVAWDTASGTYRDNDQEIAVVNFASSPFKTEPYKRLEDFAYPLVRSWPFSQAVWASSFFMVRSWWLYAAIDLVLHKLLGFILDTLAATFGHKPVLGKIYKKMDAVEEHIHYFSSNMWEFKIDNISNLWSRLTEEDKALFKFDVSGVDFLDQVMIGKLGLRYYFLKDKMETIPAAERRFTLLHWAHRTLRVVSAFAALKILVYVARALPF